MVGIYKIINPKGKIYIGQSTNIKNRKKHYKYLNSSSIGSKLFNSLRKYGWENHKFKIIEECSVKDLGRKEKYWKVYYNSIQEGLNIQFDEEKGGILSEETRKKISNAWKNKTKEELLIINEKRRQGNLGKPKPGAGRKSYTKEQKIALGNRSYYKSEDFLNKCKTPVLMLDKFTEEILKEFGSVTEAAYFIGVKQGTLSGCLTGRAKTSGGYKWRYKEL